MGKKGGGGAAAPQIIVMPDPPEPAAPIVFEMPEMPSMPEIPPMPEVVDEPVKDWDEEELAAENAEEEEKANRLRVGRQATIMTSPLIDEEDVEVAKPSLLGS